MHEFPLITTVAAAFTAAWLLALLTQRLGLSPIVGYLLAGVLIGPHTPGFVGDVHLAHQLAEVGVILLMFGVGLHFHLKDLLAVKAVAIPGAAAQSLAATLLGLAIFAGFGLPVTTAAVIGMAMAVASTVVLIRVLMDADVLNSPQGHVAVGWLIVEDIFTVVVLVLIPVLAGKSSEASAGVSFWRALGFSLLKLSVLVAIVMLAGSRVIPWMLVQVARLRSRELFTLTVLVLSIAVAAGAYLFFDASMALGAFLAGMVVAQSPASHQAAADAFPMRDAFAVLFFVSVGMLLDPMFLLEQPFLILAALGIILIAKPLVALVVVALLGHSVRTSLTVALGLAQIGEFSFILSELAGRHGIMSDTGHNVLVASAIFTIALNPVLFRLLPRIEQSVRRYPRLWKLLNGRAERRALEANRIAQSKIDAAASDGKRLAVVIGFGPVGRSVHRLLQDAGLETVVVDLNMDTVSELSESGLSAVFGDASHESILEQAGVPRASYAVITLPDASARLAVVTAVRSLNAQARILVRARYLRERENLERAGATGAVFEEAEAAVALARLVLGNAGEHREVVEQKLRDIRLQLMLENMSTLRVQRVRGVMVPWTQVRRITAGVNRQAVLEQIAQHRFSRWPVVDSRTGAVQGYLLTKDMITGSQADWTSLLRAVHRISAEDDIGTTLLSMQADGATISIVEEKGVPVGLVTLEDMLEQVVGRIEDEYPHDAPLTLRDAIARGGVILELAGRTREQAIAELASAFPAAAIPPGANVAELALAREAEFSTDLGNGVAIPHARVSQIGAAMVVCGRSAEGILFSSESPELVRLVFLLVTPADHSDFQLSLLSQIARIAADATCRERLLNASNPTEFLDVVAEADSHAGGSTS